MNKLLLIIDLQKDFINEYTQFLPKKISELIERNDYKNVVFTRFINDKNNVCYKRLKYTGCIEESGKKIVIDTQNNEIVDKSTYTALTENIIKYIKNNKIDEIYLCGIDTECCVLKTAFDMFENLYNVYVLKDYCASIHGTEVHNNAIKLLERNIGKEYII